MSDRSIRYRADIDGLRAIAVLAVMGFHVFPGFVAGGFVGVDIFFVVSGYLITSIILSQQPEDQFTFRHFYRRRIARILPALLLTLAGSYILGWFILFPSEFQQLGRHIVAAAGFVSNVVLLRETGYFDVAAHTKPLLHLWSLAVEEQFYVVWPLLVWIAWRRKVDLLALVITISVTSFILNLSMPARTAAFYSPFSRFWELMAGSALACVSTRQRSRVHDMANRLLPALRATAPPVFVRHQGDIQAVLGTILIAFAILKTRAENFPGAWTLLPVAGAYLVISAGPRAWINRALLSQPVLVNIGLISYPLYLFHWPLLSLAWIVQGAEPSLTTRLSIVAVSFVLAGLTYVAVEQPIRSGPPRRLKTIALCGSLLVMAGIAGLTDMWSGLPFRPVAIVNQAIADDLKVPTGSRTSNASCVELLGVTPAAEETCLASAARLDLLVIGDSQAMAFNSAVYARFSPLKTVLASTNLDVWGRPECLGNIPLDDWQTGNAACMSVVRHALAIAAQQDSINTVVIVFQWGNAFFLNRDRMLALQNEFRALRKKIVYVLNVPVFSAAPSSCTSRKVAFFAFEQTDEAPGSCSQSRSELEPVNATTRSYVENLRGGSPDIRIFDPMPAFCDAQHCYQADRRGALYWMVAHVNERGSARMLSHFIPWLQTPAKPSEVPH